MRLLLLATLGGAIGSGARYLVNVGTQRVWGSSFPWSTLIVNVLGCMAMGVLHHLFLSRYGNSTPVRVFWTTGVLGGFTTFSAFSLDFALLAERQAPMLAVAYLLGSVVLSLAGVFTGLGIARSLWP